MYPHTYASNSICPQHTRLKQHVPSHIRLKQHMSSTYTPQPACTLNIYNSTIYKHIRFSFPLCGNVTEPYTYAQAGHIHSSYHIDGMVYQTLRNDLAYTVHKLVYLPGHPANASLIGKLICHRDRSLAVSTDRERVRPRTGTERVSPQK